MPSMLCRPRPSRGDQRTLEGASREDGRGRLSARRGLVPGGGGGGWEPGEVPGVGCHRTAGDVPRGPGQRAMSADTPWGVTEQRVSRALRGAPRGAGEEPGRPGAQPPLTPPPAPRARRFTHQRPWLRGRLAATILFPPRWRGCGGCGGGGRPPPPSSPLPALDNALVKTAEFFLTSPPTLLIKAPP
jgi:hypothetical protein